MNVNVAGHPLFLDVGHFTARGQFAIPSHHASAGERPKSKESYETHGLSPDRKPSNPCAARVKSHRSRVHTNNQTKSLWRSNSMLVNSNDVRVPFVCTVFQMRARIGSDSKLLDAGW